MRIRAFVSLELDAGARDRLGAAVAELRPGVPGVKWVRPEGVHLTLRFLGPSEPETLERLKPLLAAAAAACPAADAPLSGFGTFPERGAPRVLWAGVALPPACLELQRACEAAAVACGYAGEARAFSPHLTLGRWRDRAARPALPSRDLGASRIETLVLMRSDLRPDGAVYTPLASFPLAPR
jgi:2'-5' RNA ligase